MSEFVTLNKEQKLDLLDKVLMVNENSGCDVFFSLSPHVDADIKIWVHNEKWKIGLEPDVEFTLGGYIDSEFSQSISYEEACQRLMNLITSE